jgi:hypothetical protein
VVMVSRPEQPMITNIRASGLLVHPTKALPLSDHEPDKRICSWAAANADYIITGNRKHFRTPLSTHANSWNKCTMSSYGNYLAGLLERSSFTAGRLL